MQIGYLQWLQKQTQTPNSQSVFLDCVYTHTRRNRRMFVRSGIIVHESIARTYTSGCGNDADDAATVEKNESNAS